MTKYIDYVFISFIHLFKKRYFSNKRTKSNPKLCFIVKTHPKQRPRNTKKKMIDKYVQPDNHL